MEHTFYLTFNNKPGTLIRIALLFERRGYSMNFMEISEEKTSEGFSTMKIKATGDNSRKEQVIKQLEKLVDVFSVKTPAPEKNINPTVLEPLYA
ncbi:MAG: ACT domain-containing protein [Cytophagaceae bacterium]